MKNIEKYPNTKDALDAYNKLNSRESFETWLKLEFEEPIEQSLLETAENLVKTWNGGHGYMDITDNMRSLSYAIEREKRKPIRNCDLYENSDEAFKGHQRAMDDYPLETNVDYDVWLFDKAKEGAK